MVDVVATLRATAPDLRILTTSREALRTPGEIILELKPLHADADADAVRLFTERALEVKPDFDADAQAGLIAEICHRFDGLPLAIGLAAHNMDVLTPQALLSTMAERLDLLTDTRHAAIGSRRNLRDAIQWSYDLLDAKEQEVFTRLALLPGGFDQQSAAAVTADLGLSRPQLWALLAGLARKSMIAIDPQRPGRFRMLQSLRAYGEEALTAAGGLAPAQSLLLNWLATFDSATPPAQRSQALAWLAKNDARRGDRDAAVRHSNDALELAHGTDDAWTLVLALTTVMMTRGNTGDLRGGIQAGHELLELVRRMDRPDMTGQILNKQAWLLIANGDLAAARAAITEATRLYKSQADSSRPLADRFANHYGMTLLHNAAMAAVLQQDDTTAAEYITAVLTMPVPDRDYVLGAIECAALIAVRRKHFALALTLIAGTTTVGHPVHSLWVRHLEAAANTAEQAIGPAAAKAASVQGSSMTVAQLIALALNGDTLLGDDPTGVLTRRELAVARRVAGGLTNGQIAMELHLSPRTIASHLANIRTKLGVQNRVEVALWVTRSNPLEPPGCRARIGAERLY